MKVKRIIAITLILIMAMSTSSLAKTLYAPDGRTINVNDWEVYAYLNVGWYEQPVTTMYAPDGRSINVYTYDVAKWESVGWVDGRRTTTIYAPDGRTATIPLWQLQSYLNVGWYSTPPSSQQTSYSTSSSFYPRTQIPTLDSIVGGRYRETISEPEYSLYIYECDSVNQYYNYMEHLKSLGWNYSHNHREGGYSNYGYMESYIEYYTKPGSGIFNVAIGCYTDPYDKSFNVGVATWW